MVPLGDIELRCPFGCTSSSLKNPFSFALVKDSFKLKYSKKIGSLTKPAIVVWSHMVPNGPPRDPVAISTDHALCLHRVDHMLHMKQRLLAQGCRSHHPEQFEQGHGPRLHENQQFQSTRWAWSLFCFPVSPPAFAFSWTFQDLRDGIQANKFLPVAEKVYHQDFFDPCVWYSTKPSTVQKTKHAVYASCQTSW